MIQLAMRKIALKAVVLGVDGGISFMKRSKTNCLRTHQSDKQVVADCT